MDDSSFSAMAGEIVGLLGIDCNKQRNRKFSTNAVHGYGRSNDALGAISYPLYQSATFAHPALHESTGFAYSRCGNPTVLELENTIAVLEDGLKSLAFTSGLAAITCLLKLFKSGDCILAEGDLHGGTYRLFNDIYKKQYGIQVEYADFTNLSAVEHACASGVAALFLETPTNPGMKIIDIAALAEIAHAYKAPLIVDNTFLTSYFQKPFELGADIVIYSGTKYLCGHNDCTSGFIVLKDDTYLEPLFMSYMSEGAALAPFEAWLMLRSLQTLPLRLEKQQQNALALCEFLHKSPQVTNVRYAGDPAHPHYDLSLRQTSGFGGMISFETDTETRAINVLSKVNLISFAESLGGCESLITYPSVQTHGAMPKEMREALGVTDRLLRLSVGVEDITDLIDDLEQALR